MPLTPEWASALALGLETADQFADSDVTAVLVGADASKLRDQRIGAINETLVAAYPPHSASDAREAAAYLYGLAMGRRCKGSHWFEKLLTAGQQPGGDRR